MQVVSSGAIIYCTDGLGSHKIFASSFDESIDEITVYSEVRNTELQRGWIGNLEYETCKTQNFDNERVGGIRDSWDDVLLVSVRLSTNIEEPNTWCYKFLKK